MIKRIKNFIPGLLVLAACGGSKKHDPAPAAPPQQAVLVSPTQNELCNQGTPVLSGKSSVTFKWAAALHADHYQLVISNLLDGTGSSQSTATTQLTATLNENTPYSWSVISSSDQTGQTATSSSWMFYNSGPGIVTYAPFPAELLAPAMNASVNASNSVFILSWNGSDVSNNVLSYDLFFGTSSTPLLLKAGLTASSYTATVSAGTTYYWKIVSKDAFGNSSESALSKFMVN